MHTMEVRRQRNAGNQKGRGDDVIKAPLIKKP